MSMERLHKARTGLMCSSPFFGSLAIKLEMVIDEKSEHAVWVDGKRVGFHPSVAAELPLDELEGVLARATLNAALGHPFRRGGRDPKKWSEAAGEVACHEVIASGGRLPTGSPLTPEYKGLTVEQVYNMICAQQESDDQGQGQGQGQGSSSPSPGQPGQAGNEGQPGQGDPSPGSGEVRDSEGDLAEQAEEENEWRESLAQAVQLGRAAGKMPGSLDIAATQVIRGQVDWREALLRYFKSRAKDDHTWRRPNKRYLPSFYLPTTESHRMGVLAVALDLSGSTRQWVNDFLSELRYVKEQCNPEMVLVLPFDTQVREVIELDEFTSVDKLTFKAGGGTDFKPAVAKLAELGIEPEALVYLTDLEVSVSDYPAEPSYPVLWVSTKHDDAPFGEVIKMR